MSEPWQEALRGASTLVEILTRRARTQGEEIAYTFLTDGEEANEHLTFAELDRKARAIAARLGELTPGDGARALLLYPPGLDFVAGFLGCLYARVIAVPAYPPASRRHLPRVHAIARDARPAAVLANAATLPKLQAAAAALPELGAAAWLATDTVDDAGDWDGPPPTPDDLAFLQYTSGSTAAPKGVMVTHANLLHNELVIQRQTGHDDSTVFVGWLPLYHDMGLIGNVLQPLYLGIRCVLMSPVAFLQKPARWLAAISRFGGTTSGGPNFAYELCLRKVTPAERAGLDLSSWSLAFSGAEPVRAETLERFADAFADCGFRRQALYPCYGMAETTLMVSGGRRLQPVVITPVSAAALEQDRATEPQGDDDEVRRLVGCGHAGSDFEIVIADPATGQRLDDDRVGEIWVAGPSVARGYWNLPEITEKTFRARLADEPERGPFLRTGDLGFLREGELYVTGRLKDLIIIRGRNHYPQDVEATAERSHPALRPGCGAAFSTDADGEERLVVVHEVDRHFQGDPAAVADAIRAAVAEAHQVQVHDVELIRTGTLPKTSSGKIQRRAALAEHRAGTLDVVSRSTLGGAAADEVLGAELELDRAALLARAHRRPLVEAFLRDRFARLTRSAAAYVDPDRPLTAQGLDSLIAVELKNAVESRLGVQLPLTQLLEGPSIAEVTSSVLAQLETPEATLRPPLAAGTPEENREHPLAYGQQALWYLHRLAPDSAAYNIRGAATIDGELDVEALRRAAAALVRRHPALRTRFVEGGEEPRARVDETPAFDFRVHDGDARLAEEIHRPFDLESGPVLRLAVFTLGPRRHLLLLVVHHVVADFWSLGVLIRELGELYGGTVELEPLSLTYADFVRWQRALLAGPEGERLWSYWRQQLAGEPVLLDLPTDRPRPPVQTFAGETRTIELDAALTERLKRLSAERGATLFMTLMAAFQVLLHRWTGQDDVLVGSPTTLRGSAELAPIVGYFVNPVVIRGDFGAVRRAPFTAFLDQLRRTTLDAFAHQEYPFPLLVEKLELPHDPSRSPLFQVMFVWQQDRLPEEEGLAGFALGEEGVEVKLGPLAARSVKLPDATAQFDLSLNMAEVGGRLKASLEYATALFDGATAERLLAQLATLLAGIATAPETPVAELPLLPPDERRRLVAEWNSAPLAEEPACLHHLVAAQAARTPDAEALIGGERRLTYRQLDGAANRLARRLRELGVGPETPAGVCTARSPEMIVALLGVLKAGGVYVPLDPDYPQERLAFTLGDSRIRVLLVHGEVPSNLPATTTPVVDLADFRPEKGRDGDATPPASGVSPGNLAYLIYTSGSTGKPKGVAITHAAATAMVRWAGGVFQGDELRGVMAATSICFDLSVFEIFVPLAHGGRVIVAANALELPALAAAGEVTLVNTVPSAMGELVTGELPASVRVVNLAGEPLARDLVQKIYRHPGVSKVYNLYGPSEDTTYSTFTRVERDDPRPPSIGRPIAGSQVYLADRALRLVPQGVVGELLLGGGGLARGYLGRPALTAERFVPDAFSGRHGERLYRTGDLARYRPDADLEFLGRLDHQVKVRGFRIELGEIEAALKRRVREAVVVARADAAGDPQIVAYVVAEKDLDVGALRHSTGETLPAFMVPQAIVVLDALPLTPNGKIDRGALPAPAADQAVHDRRLVAPETEVEETLAAIWREVLGVDEIGIYDSFFDLGGHSLKATRVLSRVHQAFHVDLPVRALLDAPTIYGLEEAIARALIEETRVTAPLAITAGDEGDDEHPLTFGQQALWYLHRLAPDSAAYNIRGAAALDGELDVEALRRAAEVLVRRHPALRTRVVRDGGEPRARVDGTPAFEFRVNEGAADARLAEEIYRPFDLENGPVLRLAVFTVGPREHLLVLVVHHIVADLWSLGVLIRELGELYGRGVGAHGGAPLEPLALTYADFARWQRALIAGPEGERLRSYWRQQLAGQPAILDLPTDRPRPPVQTFAGDTRAVELDAALTARLNRLAAERGATLFMTLMAAFQVLLHRWTGQDDVLVGSPATLRGTAELAPIVGYFVNPVVIRGDLGAARRAPFTAFLDQLRRTILDAFAHQAYPFPLLVEKLELPHDPSRSPLFQVMFVWQQDRLPEEEGLAGFALGEEGAEMKLGPLAARSVKLPDATAQFDLSLHMAEVGGRLKASLEYATALFDGATAERLLAQLATLLAGIAAAPETPVGELPLLPPDERRRLVAEWNPAPLAEGPACLHDLVAAQAARTPDAEALIGLTYRQLDGAANRLARRLRELGVGPETPAGVCTARGPEMIVALLGVLKAGGVYVPLDPDYPQERLAFTLGDSRIRVLLVHGEVPANLPATTTPVVDLTDFRPEESRDGDATPPASGVSPGNLAYLIYTSGSTGKPKGVAITHAAAAAMVRWAGGVFQRGELRGVMAATSICFDLSVFEIFVPLAHGGRVIVAANALELPALPGEVTLVNTVPSAMAELVAGELPASVRVVNLAGEPLARDLVQKIYRHPGVDKVYNLYGPSEDTTYSTFTRVERDDPRPPSIGRPIAGSQVYLVDRTLGLVPQGAVGELLLGGGGLARGYLGRPALTAERFVPDAFSGRDGERLYRTGDLARYRADADLEFLGRLDHQVKVRGFRIELGEIEAALKRRVREAVVVARTDAAGDPQLVAYVVADGELDDGELRHALGETLPAFMVPQAIVVLDALPLTANGKIDREALPAPAADQAAHDRRRVAPETEVEEMLAAIWREVLDVDEIGIYDSFFDLGGHSLKATRVLSRVRDVFQVDLPVDSFLEAPTIAGLEEAIARVLMEEAGEETVAEILADME